MSQLSRERYPTSTPRRDNRGPGISRDGEGARLASDTFSAVGPDHPWGGVVVLVVARCVANPRSFSQYARPEKPAPNPDDGNAAVPNPPEHARTTGMP